MPKSGPKPHLTNAQKADVIREYAKGKLVSVIAREFGVDRKTISRVLNKTVAREITPQREDPTQLLPVILDPHGLADLLPGADMSNLLEQTAHDLKRIHSYMETIVMDPNVKPGYRASAAKVCIEASAKQLVIVAMLDRQGQMFGGVGAQTEARLILDIIENEIPQIDKESIR